VDPLGSKLGHGWLTTELKLPLLAVVGATSAGGGALVARVSGDTLVWECGMGALVVERTVVERVRDGDLPC
jgi:hypothetical protein